MLPSDYVSTLIMNSKSKTHTAQTSRDKQQGMFINYATLVLYWALGLFAENIQYTAPLAFTGQTHKRFLLQTF